MQLLLQAAQHSRGSISQPQQTTGSPITRFLALNQHLSDNPRADALPPVSHSPGIVNPAASIAEPITSTPTVTESHVTQQNSASPGQTAVSLLTHPASQAPPPKFPSASTRQRSSNVNLGNAEQEFQKTALGALRSTVTQQEVELKTLREAIDIRNKRISQLEAQVGHASNLLSDRDIPQNLSEDRVGALVDKLQHICLKFDQLTGLPSNNIVVNTCNSHQSPQVKNSTTQTEPTNPLHSEELLSDPGLQPQADAGVGQDHEGGNQSKSRNL